MNKFIRTCLIVFAVCLAIGGGILIAGIAMGGTIDDAVVQIEWDSPWFMRNGDHGLIRFGDDDDYDDDDDDDDDFDNDDAEKSEKDVQKSGGNLKNELWVHGGDVADLEMVFYNCNLQILPSKDETISMEVEESGKKYISMKLDGRTLKIKDTRKKKHAAKAKVIDMKLYVPDLQMFGEIDLDIGAGNIEIAHLSAANIDIEGGAGSLKADVLTADKEFDADLGVGDFRIRRAVFGETDISCGAGSVSIDQCTLLGDLNVSGGIGDVNIGIIGKEEDFNYELECGMGELEVFGTSYTSLGRAKEIDNGAPYTISAECGIGSVTIYETEEKNN